MDAKKILLLIGHSKIGDRIEGAFMRAHFNVIRTDDSNQMISLLKKENPVAMILDWDLTNGAMQEITRVIRENCRKTGLVLLSRSKKAEERIQVLEEGADDCLHQPPEIDELVAKVKALVRRIDLVDHAPRRIHVKDIAIDLDSHEVRKGNTLIDMTYTQFKLLHLLISKRDYVFSREEILNKVWGEHAYVTNRTVDVHVKRLREKLGEQKHHSEYIQTIHGLGYRFV